MRKHLTRIAILAVCSFGFIGITSAAPASAASCNANATATSKDFSSILHYSASVSSCTGVDKVRFYYNCAAQGCSPPYTGWYDGTEARWTAGLVGNHAANLDVNICPSNCGATVDIASGCWWYGTNTYHSVFGAFWFAIHATGGNWGPIHQKFAANYNQVLC